MSKIITRFAPSPTGYLHIGSLRTALYAYLFAKKNNGKFLLRIEDTDKSREIKGADKRLIKILKKLSIIPDNEKNIMYQSKRLSIYQKYAQQLIDEDKAYYCFCTADRLKTMRENQRKRKEPPMYDGHCLNLTPEEIEKKLKNRDKYVIRFKFPKIGITKFKDIVYGELEFTNNTIDDQIIIKSDGFPTYHLAHVVDDHEMSISHVIRADEWIPSTPKHIHLILALGWEVPQYAHVPLLTNPDKSKLSKRQGDVSVEDYLNKGYLVPALINFVALLGWNQGQGSTNELFTFRHLLDKYNFTKNEVEEIIEKFDLNNVGKSSAIFDIDKLNYLNGIYIRKLKLHELIKICQPYLKMIKDQALIKKIVTIEQERLKKLSDISQNTNFFYQNIKYRPDLLIWKNCTKEQTRENLAKLEDFIISLAEKDFTDYKILEQKTIDWIKKNEYGVGDILWPMRVALSGAKQSPGPFEIAWVLGKGNTIKRINQAQILLQ